MGFGGEGEEKEEKGQLRDLVRNVQKVREKSEVPQAWEDTEMWLHPLP